MSTAESKIDCLLFVSFGGPEGPDDVIPFLENVLRGKPVPRERLLEVAEHYQHFGGVSPINAQNRDIIARLSDALHAAGNPLPIYWGNRNWQPYITDALREIDQAGHRLALPIFTNMYSSYSGCRQYRENIAKSLQELGDKAPQVAPRLRFGFNHPKYIAAQIDLARQAYENLPASHQQQARLLVTAHSIPLSMADNCSYVQQLKESSRLVAQALNVPWDLVYQSRSGPPSQPWLEPDIGEHLRQLSDQGLQACVVLPMGFVSDHMEVMYDLDTEAKQLCEELGILYSRALAVGTHPDFISMLVDLIDERCQQRTTKQCVGSLPPLHDVCPENCCLYPQGPRSQTQGATHGPQAKN